MSIVKKDLADRCYECDSNKLVYDSPRGEVYCNDCGLVIDSSIIDLGPEWRMWTHKEVRANAYALDKTFHSVLRAPINPRERGGFDHKTARRVDLAQKRIGKHREDNLIYALDTMNRLSSQLGIPTPAREEAALSYRKMQGLVRGRTIDAIAYACVYVASRRHGHPLNWQDFEDRVDKRTLMRNVRLVQRELKQRPPEHNPLKFIGRYLSELYNDSEIEQEMQTTIDDMANKLSDEDLDSPNSDAAALIWMAGQITGHPKNQKEVAQVAGVTEVTIRNRYQPKKKKLGLNIGNNKHY